MYKKYYCLNKQFHCLLSSVYVVKNVRKQQAENKCGCTPLPLQQNNIAFEKSPCEIAAVSTEHLVQCLSDHTLELFP